MDFIPAEFESACQKNFPQPVLADKGVCFEKGLYGNDDFLEQAVDLKR